jgi:hypothetical protein
LEFALWQTAINNYSLAYPAPPASFYNFSLDTTVAGLDGAYSIPRIDSSANITVPLQAIGAQCKSSSAVGFAEVDGVTSTYKSFTRTDTPPVLNIFACPYRLALSIPQTLFPSENPDVLSNQADWPENLFTSAEAPPTYLGPESDDAQDWLTLRGTLLQASELRRSLLRAYASSAAQLMYNGGQGYAFANAKAGNTFQIPDAIGPGASYTFQNPNATAFEPGKVLSVGPVPPAVPAIFLAIWAVGTCILALVYGFGKRWADTLDSFSLFRFGADLSDQVKDNPAFGKADAEDCEELEKLPGLVGDSKPYFHPGHITLVRGEEALKNKLYL